MGEQGVRWGGCPVSHPPLLWLIEVAICNSICVAAPCQCIRAWRDIIGVAVRTTTGIFTSPTFVCVNEGRLAALWWGHLAKQRGVPYTRFTRNRRMDGQLRCSSFFFCLFFLIFLYNLILLLHNNCLGEVCWRFGPQCIFDIPLLSIQKKNMFAHERHASIDQWVWLC